MDALYSPTTQTLTIIPRLSPSSLTSSSSIAKIQSFRKCRERERELLVKLRVRKNRGGELLKCHARSNINIINVNKIKAVANLIPLPVVAVVLAMTMAISATAVFSNFHNKKNNNKKKENSQPNSDIIHNSPQASGQPDVKHDQEGKHTSEKSSHHSINGDHSSIASLDLEDEHISPKEVTQSVPDNNDNGFKPSSSYQELPSMPELASHEIKLPDDTSVTDLGTIAATLAEKVEEIGLSPGDSSSESDAVEPLIVSSEVSEHAYSGSEDDLDQKSPALGDSSSESDAVEPLVVSSEVSEHAYSGSEGDLDQKSPAPGDSSSESDAVEPLVISSEVSEHTYSGSEGDLDQKSLVPVGKIDDAVSVVVDSVPLEDVINEESNSKREESQLLASTSSGTTVTIREDVHLSYDKTIASDNPAVLMSEASLLVNGNIAGATTIAPEILREKNSTAAGIRGNGSVAFLPGGALRKVPQNEKRDPRIYKNGPSSHHGPKKVADVPVSHKMKVNKEQNVSSYLSLYNRLIRLGRLTESIELLEEMDKKDELDMNKIYHARFFNVCRDQKSVKEAFRFSKLIGNPTLSTFNMLLSVCSSAQDSRGAFEVLQMVQRAGLKADSKLYTTLISTCAKCGKVDSMFEVFHKMVNSGLEPSLYTYGALIDGCARAGQVAKAFGAYGILRSKKVKPDRVIFNALITACGQTGAVQRAFDVLAEMSGDPPVDPDHVTIGALISACTKAGQVDRVKGVYEMMQKYNIKGTPEVYTIAVNSCSLNGDWEFACNIYDDMKKKGVVPDEMFFSALIDVAGHAGKIDVAFRVLQDARNQGMNLGSVAYSSLMGACSNNHDWEKALELFEQIKVMKLNPTVSTVNALITALCDGKKIQKALDVFLEMKKLGFVPNAVTYSILLAASDKNDTNNAVFDLYSQAKADGISFTPIMFASVIRMCSRKFESACTRGESVFSFESGRPQIDTLWTTIALALYREMIGAGLTPSIGIVAQVLGCLRLPQDRSLKKRLTETLETSTRVSKRANLLSLIDGFGEYDPRALSLFEEASSLGIVPSALSKETPTIFIDATNLGIQLVEVYILTVLKGLKHRLAAGAKLPNLSISLPTETTKILGSEGDKTINVSARVSQGVGGLMRRLRLPYQGSESQGKIRISGLVIKKWLQPILVPVDSGTQTQRGPPEFQLSSGISRQQRNIRTGNLSL